MLRWIILLLPLYAYAPNENTHYKVSEEERVMYISSICEFRTLMGFKESSSRYDTINSIGYIGKYQFGRQAMEHLGADYDYYRHNLDAFTPYMQEDMFNRLMAENRRILRKEMAFIGKTIHGVKVTESGLLAAAHLAGAGGVKAWIYKGEDKFDINGTKISAYMEYFRGIVIL